MSFTRQPSVGVVRSVVGVETDVLSTESGAGLRRSVVWFMAVAAAVGTAAIYPLQPAIAEVAGSVGASVTAIGTALACGPVGYLLGLALLVPLVDLLSPKIVLALQFAALAAAFALNAAATTPWMLGFAVGLIGIGSTVGAQLSSVAGRFAAAGERATMLGIVTAGISAGILGGRIVGGWLTSVVGWRGTLLVFAGTCLAMAAIAFVVIPSARRSTTSGYLATLRGLPGLYVRFPALRVAAGRGTLWFFGFCAIWSGIAVALAQPPFSYSPERIGLYAVAGLLGIAATRIAGSWVDRVGARRVILIGLVVAAAAAATLGWSLSSTAVTLVCLGLFDAGLFAAQVANQSTVLAINPGAPAQFNSAYMVVYFIGGSLGTAFGAAAVGWFGWPATAAITAGVIAVALVITRTASTPSPPAGPLPTARRGTADER